MNLPGHWTFALLLGGAVAGCSFVLDLDTEQCETTADCRSKGAAFADLVCIQGSCEAAAGGTDPSNPDDGTGGTTGSGGSTSSATAGSAGQDSAGGCVSTPQCVKDNLDEPYVCVKPGTPCVALKTAECPLVMGDYEKADAVYLGAILNVPAAAPLSQMSTLNVQLAVDEFNSAGGLPGGPLGKLRPLVTVVCRNESALLEQAAEHLIDTLKVPGVVAHLPSADLKTFFVNHALPKGVFVINPGFADNSLTSLATQGLFWHMIGDVRDVAPAYTPLLSRIESFLGASEELRVAMVVSKRFAEQSIADTMVPKLRFNGKSVSENGSNFFTTTVTAMADDPKADYSAANADLLGFKPHVVIALTREEFVARILPTIEGGWATAAPGQARPFYIVPTALSGNLDLVNYIAVDSDGATSENKRQRIVGVAPASAEDMTLYDQFLVRFRSAFPRFQNPGGFENFYDAVYLLANATYAAGAVPELTGGDLARGMQRVVTGNTLISVGPTHIGDVFTALSGGGKIRLNGTMGPADFDPGVGARRGSGSVYCYPRKSGMVSITYDVLRYDTENETLTGTFSCFEGF
jgi:ABC-type branched-subunit amino acid transport system substrate-binding protein